MEAVPEVGQEIVQVALFYLVARRFGREQRNKIVEALDFVTAIVRECDEWTVEQSIDDMDIFPPGFFDDYEFGVDDDDEPGDVD
jgi:hypothetical protein